MRNNSFMTGVLAGAALGALVVLAISPQMRRPMMDGTDEMGARMRRMWRRGSRWAEEMVPGNMRM